ncbi:MAG: acetyl-CoA hydrolase/transferase C-terminal domain-containing protein, partial [Oleiphilaceae bacterium]|nr:acetyl-CoA hydrolase/transferase C-terminal domain-containing protein [Oleiphilaceae bacterium]
RVQSNIRFNHEHCTIPRHLRDIVVTEYGIADLRSKPDAQVYQSLIQIADSRFQPELLSQAQKAGKVPRGWKVPRRFRHNRPEYLEEALFPFHTHHKLFPAFPFSCDFSDEELELARALKALKAATANRRGLLRTLASALRQGPPPQRYASLMERMGLASPGNWREKLEQRLLVWALQRSSG